ncbi:MAG: ABC transporter permease subunit [Bacteroidetes bacterium]|nr:ABC transporter permease subunit [Bacteroidota bacterium]
MYSAMLAIYRREIRLYFNTPVAFIATIIFLLFVGWFFNSTFFLQNAATVRTLFEVTPFAFLFFVPALTMKVFADELRSGTYDLMISKPVSLTGIITGKFLATLTVVAVFLAPTLLCVVLVSSLAPLDWGPVAGGYLGMILLASIYASIGIFASTLTDNQIIAFITGFVISFLFYIAGNFSMFLPQPLAMITDFLSIDNHIRGILRGVVDTRDLVYAISMVTTFLTLAWMVLTHRREK